MRLYMTDDSDSTLRPGKPAWAAELSEREWLFCEQFAVDLNATEAAVRAGYGKTRKRAKEQASKLRRNPRIAAAISRLVAERAGVTQTTLLTELGAIARSRVTDVLGLKDGDLIVKDLSELTDEQLGAIEAIEEVLGPDGAKTLKIKFHDKLGAIALLMKALGMNKSRVELSGPGGAPIQVETTHAVAARVLQRLDALAAKQLPAPTESPLLIEATPVKDTVND
jgi:phage terminase small subunit